jgi:hypothetical protein
MIFQLHHQDIKTGSSEMIAQREFDETDNDAAREFFDETAKSHPLPAGKQWLFCNEKSKHFVGCDEAR